MKSQRNLSISIAGAGNVGTFLAVKFLDAGCRISQIYSRTLNHAVELSSRVNAEAIDNINRFSQDTDVIIVALPDKAIPSFFKEASVYFQNSGVKPILASTAGSVLLDELTTHYPVSGVFYPLQSFAKNTKPDSRIVPVCIEGSSEIVAGKLNQVASIISDDVRQIDSNQRLKLHLAAVFACNFSNHMIALADELAAKAGIDFSVLRPLIMETFTRLKDHSPASVQTGPAIRGDYETINKHLQLLEEIGDPNLKTIYSIMSESIKELSLKNL